MLAVLRSARPIGTLVVLVVTTTLATQTVEIDPGDTLSQIAAETGVSVGRLVEWNDISDPDLIYAGDVLVIQVDDGDGTPSTYIIEPGDTLSEIARRFGSSIADLVEANDLTNPDLIVAGHELMLLGEVTSDQASSSPDTTAYTVRSGDTLITIARVNGVGLRDLAEANGIDDLDRIFVGQSLTIPSGSPRAGGESTPPPATTTPTTTAPPSTTTTPPSTTTTAPPSTSAPPPSTSSPPPPTTIPAPAPGSSTGLSTFFERWSAAYGVDRGLLEALLWKESGWQADAVGPGGHLGIGQLSPERVAFVEERLLGVDLDPLDASDGIRLAARFLRFLLDRTDDERTALAAWNQGLGSVDTNGISAAAGAFADEVLAIRRERA